MPLSGRISGKLGLAMVNLYPKFEGGAKGRV